MNAHLVDDLWNGKDNKEHEHVCLHAPKLYLLSFITRQVYYAALKNQMQRSLRKYCCSQFSLDHSIILCVSLSLRQDLEWERNPKETVVEFRLVSYYPQGVLTSLPISLCVSDYQKGNIQKKWYEVVLKNFSQNLFFALHATVKKCKKWRKKVLLALLIGFWLEGEICLKI